MKSKDLLQKIMDDMNTCTGCGKKNAIFHGVHHNRSFDMCGGCDVKKIHAKIDKEIALEKSSELLQFIKELEKGVIFLDSINKKGKAVKVKAYFMNEATLQRIKKEKGL